jgi:hypothetical protein
MNNTLYNTVYDAIAGVWVQLLLRYLSGRKIIDFSIVSGKLQPKIYDFLRSKPLSLS